MWSQSTESLGGCGVEVARGGRMSTVGLGERGAGPGAPSTKKLTPAAVHSIR